MPERTKGPPGGARPGAGRHVSTVMLKAGQQFLLHQSYDGQAVGLGEVATVRIVHRNKLEIVMEDGHTVYALIR
jgi:hypothetical protein